VGMKGRREGMDGLNLGKISWGTRIFYCGIGTRYHRFKDGDDIYMIFFR
jgi:hypothetical protein